MNEEEQYKLLNIPNKPWIELTDEEKELFNKNDNYIKQLQQENTQLKRMLNKKQKIIDKAKTKSIELQNRYGYILDDLIFLLDILGGVDNE